MDKETYDSLPLMRLLDKSGKPIEDSPELPSEHRETTILKKKSGSPEEILLKSKIDRETLKAKGYDLDEVETGKATMLRQDLMRLLEKLSDDKPMVSTKRNDEPETTIMRRKEVLSDENSLRTGEPENK